MSSGSSGKGLLDTPEVVRCIPEFIEDWEKRGGYIFIKTKDAPFKELHIRNVPIFIGFEQKTEFSCQLDVMTEDQMSEASAEVYRRLKGMECELIYTGSLIKKPAFKPMRLLEKLKKEIPELSSNDTLIRKLSGNDKLMRLLSNVRPDDFVIMLQSFTPEGAAAAGSPEGVTKIMAEFYRKPTRMSWMLSLTRLIPRGPSTKSLNRGIFGILKLSSQELLDLTNSYLSQKGN